MAELTQGERLQPSLLDRLTDNEPERKVESSAQRVLSVRELRKCVLRDIAWLLNTENLGLDLDAERYPEAARSVLNYGMPGLTGYTVSHVETRALERRIRQVIIDYEPRILKNTVQVRVVVDDKKMDHNAIVFEIEGELWAQPAPLHLYMKTELDLESGHVEITESGGGG